MKRCVAIFGPTASGKSSLALKLAFQTGGEIISADSMQIYREMNIGTAKPSRDEMSLVPHRMIDICSPLDSFSVYDYKKRAELEIRSVLSEGKVPLITGGTGLYFDSLFFNTDFGKMETDPKIRESLEKRVSEGEAALLLEKLRDIDPEAAAPLHEKDVKRIIRALEVFLSTGKTLTEFKKSSRGNKSEFSYLKIFLNYSDRTVLYDRINKRVDQMVDEGLVEEARRLLTLGYFSGATAPQAIGYKELLPYLSGEKSLKECVENLKQKTRNYAKRQLTWFRRYEDAHLIWMDTDPDPYRSALALIEKYLKEN